MARSIVVPVAGSAESLRAVTVAAGLARRAALPLELVHVCLPGADEVSAARWLRAAADGTLLEDVACTLLHGDDPVPVLIEALADRPDSLVVLGTAARGPLTELLLGSVSEALLAHSDRPMLLVGPHVQHDEPLGPSLVAAVADRRAGELLVEPVSRWIETFGGEPWFVQVAAPTMRLGGRNDSDTTETGLVHRLASRARERGVDAQWDVLHGRNAPGALLDFATSMGGGVVAVASERWADPHQIHWASTARALVHRSPYPVLVVPVHMASALAS